MKVVFSQLPIITLTLSSLFIFLLLLIFFSNSYWTSKTSSSNSLYVIPNFSKNKLFNSSFTLFTCILSPIYNFYKFIIYKLKIISKLLIIFDNISIYMSFLVLLDLCFQCFYEYQYKYRLQIVCFLKT